MSKTYFTIFTSTYNRKHTIHRVWESLINQTNKNFEWILIDNGSEDNVLPLLEDYRLKADFPVRLYTQENLGRYRAFDRAVSLAKGELFIGADSDDRFDSNTIERFDEIWNKYKNTNISGINVLCRYEDGTLVGEKFPINEGVSDLININYKHKVGGEKWGCVRVDLLRKYRFPTNFQVKHFEDDYLWFQIGFDFEAIYLNETLRVYYQDAGNQVTHNKIESDDVINYKIFYTLWKINYVYPKIEKYISNREYSRTYVFLWINVFKSGTQIIHPIKELIKYKSKAVALLLLPPSYLITIFNLKLDFLKPKKYKYQL